MQTRSACRRYASLGRKSTQQKPLHAVGMQPIPFFKQSTQRGEIQKGAKAPLFVMYVVYEERIINPRQRGTTSKNRRYPDDSLYYEKKVHP